MITVCRFSAAACLMHHYQLPSVSGRRPPIRDLTKRCALVVHRAPIERSQNRAEGKVFTEVVFRSVYMECGYLNVGTMNAAGKQTEVFVILNKTGRNLNLVDRIQRMQG